MGEARNGHRRGRGRGRSRALAQLVGGGAVGALSRFGRRRRKRAAAAARARPAAPEGQADLFGPAPKRLPCGAARGEGPLLARRERRRRSCPHLILLRAGPFSSLLLPQPFHLPLPLLLAPRRRREALRPRPRLLRGALRHHRLPLQGGVGLPHRPLSGQGADAEHALPAVRQRALGPGLVEAARGKRADHVQGAFRDCRARRVFRQVWDRAGRDPKPPDSGTEFFFNLSLLLLPLFFSFSTSFSLSSSHARPASTPLIPKK